MTRTVPLPIHIKKQLDIVFTKQKRRVPDRRTLDWAKKFTELFLQSRIQRSRDLSRPELQKARTLELAYVGRGNHHFMVGCMDGRNMPAVMLSHVPHVGGVMRTQAGELFGFQSGTSNDAAIDMDSYEAHLITKLLLGKPGEIVHYSFDSHIGCAARARISKMNGIASDNGLRADIVRKQAIARGILHVHDQLKKQGKPVASIYPQFFSYDPHDGTIIMGLETQVDAEGQHGFTEEVLNSLTQKKAILRTWDFLSDPTVVDLLEKHVTSPVDFKNRFAPSLLSNWEAITMLYGKGNGALFRMIVDRLQTMYRRAGWKIEPLVIENKAKIMLKNLVTRWSIAKNDHHWPFDKHNEQAIIFSEGGYAPFPAISVFSLFSKEDNRLLLDHTYLALELIRNFRAEGAKRSGGIVDPLGILEGQDFIEAPILIMNKSILRDMPEAGWKKIQTLDLTLLSDRISWDDFSVRGWRRDAIEHVYRDVLSILSYKEAECLLNGLYELFDRQRYMMLEDYRFRSLILEGSIIVVNMLFDKDRSVRAIVPIEI